MLFSLLYWLRIWKSSTTNEITLPLWKSIIVAGDAVCSITLKSLSTDKKIFLRSEGDVKDSLRVFDWIRVCLASLIDNRDWIFLIQSKRSAEGQMRVKNFYCTGIDEIWNRQSRNNKSDDSKHDGIATFTGSKTATRSLIKYRRLNCVYFVCLQVHNSFQFTFKFH